MCMICPECNYERKLSDLSPAWQCPACGIAYQKYKKIRELNVKEQREWVDEIRKDSLLAKKLYRIEAVVAVLAISYLIIDSIFRGSVNYTVFSMLMGISFLVLTIVMLKLGVVSYSPYGCVSREKDPTRFKLQIASSIGVTLIFLYLGIVSLLQDS